MLNEDDFPTPEFYILKMVQARKDHVCHECVRTISRGELHESVSAKWDGEVQRVRTCAHCLRIRSAFVDLNGLYVHGVLSDFVGEYCGESLAAKLLSGHMMDQWQDCDDATLDRLVKEFTEEATS